MFDQIMSDRELEILALIADGYSNTQIAKNSLLSHAQSQAIYTISPAKLVILCRMETGQESDWQDGILKTI